MIYTPIGLQKLWKCLGSALHSSPCPVHLPQLLIQGSSLINTLHATDSCLRACLLNALGQPWPTVKERMKGWRIMSYKEDYTDSKKIGEKSLCDTVTEWVDSKNLAWGDFPGGPVVGTVLPTQGRSSIPGWETKIPQALRYGIPAGIYWESSTGLLTFCASDSYGVNENIT